MGMVMANTDNAPPLALPLTFFITGLVGLAAALVDLLFHAGDLLHFRYGTGAILSATHFMTLGFLSMVMMGAMYQLVPVVLNTELRSPRLGFWHYGLFAPGVLLMVTGFLKGDNVWLMVGGSLVVVSVVLFLVNMIATLKKSTTWDLSGVYVSTSIGYLSLTVTMGWILAYNLWRPFLPTHLALPVHIALGAVGWFTLTLLGVSYKLLPMFSLTHAKPRFGWWVYTLINSAIWTVALGSWWKPIPSVVAGGVLAAGGLLLYLMDLRRFWRRRMRRQADPAVYLALSGAALGPMTAVAVLWCAASGTSWMLPFFLFFFGWLAVSILGYLQKIVPFLLWLHRYSKDIGKVSVPRMRDILNERWTWQVGTGYLVGLVAAVVGLIAGTEGVLRVGLGVMLIAVVWLLGVVAYVVWNPAPTVRTHPSG